MIVVYIFLALTFIVIVFMQQDMFGKTPTGERLERIKKSPNFKDGKFENLRHTPFLTEGVSYYVVLKEFIFSKNKRGKPSKKNHQKKQI